MKRTKRPLSLHAETIRTLNLSRVRGGAAITSDVFQCGTFTCDVTCTSNTCGVAP